MAIKIRWQAKPPQGGEAQGQELFPRLVDNGVVEHAQLCKAVAEKSSFTSGVIQGILDDLVDQLIKQLAEGKRVRVDGLGEFRLSVGTCVPVSSSDVRRASKVRVKGVSFSPAAELLPRLGDPAFQTVGYEAPLGATVSERMIEQLKGYLQTHEGITRAEVETLLGWKRSTATYRLKALVTSGLLRAEGYNRNTRYYLA